MNETTPSSKPGGTASRYVLILLCAAIGFGAALAAAALLPIHEDTTMWLAYPAVFAVAAISITLIFQRFVMRR